MQKIIITLFAALISIVSHAEVTTTSCFVEYATPQGSDTCTTVERTVNGVKTIFSTGYCPHGSACGKKFSDEINSSFLSSYNFDTPTTPATKYHSDYAVIAWDSKSDTTYCLDITDTKWSIYPGFKAIQCGKGSEFFSFSPIKYVTNVLQTTLPLDFQFNWRIWQQDAKGLTTYGGDGYQGTVVVTP